MALSLHFRKIVANSLGTNFRKVTAIIESSINEVKESEVVVKNSYAGINASDINFTAGYYLPGVEPPFDTGFEAVGEVVAVGDGVTDFKPGDAVGYTGFGAFSEYKAISSKQVIKLPRLMPEALPLLVSGLTASISLEQVGEMKSGETVLVTAAAGGTGTFAVQLAKLAGNHVIGTCGSDEKIDYLRQLGCDRVVNYKKEDLFSVLRSEYPNGVDLIYESVGGAIFDACVKNLATRGRLIVIGMISGYQDKTCWKGDQSKSISLPAELLSRSASIRGFFLNHYIRQIPRHLLTLFEHVQQGKLLSSIDSTPFHGLESVADAIDHMYSGKNIGKVIVHLNPNEVPIRSRL